MKRLMMIAAVALMPSAVCAEEIDAAGWEKSKIQSGTVAGGVNGIDMELRGSAGLSWPNGQQGVVTYWQDKGGLLTYRCVDFLKPNAESSGGHCWVVKRKAN